MTVTNCPTCGADLGGHSICARCGTLAAMEVGFAQLKIRAKQFVGARLAVLPHNFQPHHFLWACAVMPVFILPPLVSLVCAVKAMRGSGGNLAPSNVEWIAIVSAINLVLSALFLYKYHFSAMEVISYINDAIRALMRMPSLLIPGQHQPVAHVIPT